MAPLCQTADRLAWHRAFRSDKYVLNSVILSIKLDLDRSTKFSVGSFFSQNGFVFIGAGGDGVVVVVVFYHGYINYDS